MARTPSNMLKLDTIAPDFFLPDTNSNEWKSFNDIKGNHGTLVMFICNHCPFVLHVIDEIIRVANDYRVQGIGFVAISSNDAVSYPEDAPEEMTEFAFNNKFSFPYLYDETQETAKKYDDACTPDFYLFNAHNNLDYRGHFDDSRPRHVHSISGRDMRNDIDSLLDTRSRSPIRNPSIVCNIKWK